MFLNQVWLILLFITKCMVLSSPSGDFYSSDNNIYELTASNFDKVVHKSNYTTIVEFYAPWCGYCNQLKPAYQKLGKFIQKDSKYAINVAAVNCDKNYNKQLCGEQQVSGFPTLKVFRPPKYDANNKPLKPTRHMAEVYQGERGFKSLVNFLTTRIKNYVKKLHLIDHINQWINDVNNSDYRYKVLLLTTGNSVSPTYKSIAIDFLNSVKFGYLTVKDKLDTKSVNIGDVKVELPINDSDATPMLFLIDTVETSILRYIPDTKMSDKLRLSEWLMQKTGHVPIEGELSKKDKQYYSNYRMGKKAKKIDHDEL